MSSTPRLTTLAEEYGTPLYVYDADLATTRVEQVRALFAGRFGISYALKANPNLALCRALRPHLDGFDASSVAEVERAVACGMSPAAITFSGPAKREREIARAVELGIGELVVESLAEARVASDHARAAGTRQPCLVRLNPLRVPRRFGASMAGSASQFGVDEETIEETLPEIVDLPGLRVIGFHCYSGTNCLDADAIAENFEIFADVFRRARSATGIEVERLVFGSGFGIPYHLDETELEVEQLPGLVLPTLDTLLAEDGFGAARCTLEMGRWLVGPAGWLVTRVIGEKHSRGSEIRTCDAGFNNHLAACGMMGAVIRRNWRFRNLTNPDGEDGVYTLVGPLCTTIDRLALDVTLPQVRPGDALAIPNSGAYGFSASPTRFISHPDPAEVVLHHGTAADASEAVNPAGQAARS